MRTSILWLATLTYAGCIDLDSSSDGESSVAERALVLRPADMHVAEICRSLMLRQRECSAAGIPALSVSAREEHELYGGDREIAALCHDIAEVVTVERGATLRFYGTDCLSKPDCEAFVSCVVPLGIAIWNDPAPEL